MNNQVLIELLRDSRNLLAIYKEQLEEHDAEPDDVLIASQVIADIDSALATPAPIPDAGGGVLLGADNRTAMVSPDAYSVILEREKIIREGALQASAMVVPDGWRLVPVEPTREMLKAGGNNSESGRPYEAYRPSECAAIYCDMLAASPAPGDSQ